MAIPGYNVGIFVSGTSTAVTAETFTNTTGNTWQIDTSSKQVWDPTASVTFKDNGVAISTVDILSIDYMFGTVTFTGSKTGPITADLNYIPLLSIAGGYEVTMTCTNTDLDNTEFGSNGTKSVTLGLSSMSGSFSVWANPADDLDPGAGTRKLGVAFKAQTLLLFSFTPNLSASGAIRTWGYMTKLEPKAGVADLAGYSVDFVSTNLFDSAGRPVAFSIVVP